VEYIPTLYMYRPGQRDSVPLGYPNTQKRNGNAMCNGAFLTKFEVFR